MAANTGRIVSTMQKLWRGMADQMGQAAAASTQANGDGHTGASKHRGTRQWVGQVLRSGVALAEAGIAELTPSAKSIAGKLRTVLHETGLVDVTTDDAEAANHRTAVAGGQRFATRQDDAAPQHPVGSVGADAQSPTKSTRNRRPRRRRKSTAEGAAKDQG